MAKAGKIIRLHKGMEERLAVRWDSRPAERAIQNDVRDYYDLLADALRKIKLDEDELDYLRWLFTYGGQVLPHERKALWITVGRLALQYPFSGSLHPNVFAARLAKLSPLENLAISDAMERAVSHESYRVDIPQTYRAMGLLPPNGDDPFPRPPVPTPPYVISSEVLKTSDSWAWPTGWEAQLVGIRKVECTAAELAHIDCVAVDLSHPSEREALLKVDPLLAAIGKRMDERLAGIGWWTVVDMIRMVRKHPDYDTNPVAAYRAAGLCR